MGSVHGEADDPQDDDKCEDEGQAVDVEHGGMEILTELQRIGAKAALRKDPDQDEASYHRKDLEPDTNQGCCVGGHGVSRQVL